MKKVLFGAVILSASQMFGAITPTLTTVVSNGSGGYTWTYNVQLAADQDANGGPAPGASTTAGVGVVATTADYFTIYDFAGFIPGSNVQPVGWSFQTLPGNLGSTPSDTIPTDSATIQNLTWYVNAGTTFHGPQNLGNFTADSIFNLQTPVNYTGQGTRNTGFSPGTEISNIGTVGAPSGVPEPATYALIGSSLAALGLLRRRS